jgi:HlyD family secretion protein
MNEDSQADTSMSPRSKSAPSFTIRWHVIAGSFVIATLVFGVGGWAATAELSGAVIAPGTLVVERNVKKVQHRDGGIVSSIHVRNGQPVQSGEILVGLDDTQIRAELNIIQSQLAEMRARRVRLMAERDGAEVMSFPSDFDASSDLAHQSALGEKRQFDENRKTRLSQKEQLNLRITQLGDEIDGLSAQRDAKKRELVLIEKELGQVRKLNDQKLTPISRVYSMERESNRLSGELGNFIAQIARAGGQISEIHVQLIAVDQNVKTEAQGELRQIDSKIAELSEREIAVKDRLNHVDIRAPVSGIVHELAVHTVGGVITPAEQVLLIVPASDELIVEARFAPTDIDQVVIGRNAVLRLSAFSQKDTPELDGTVLHISADVTRDERNGTSYYMGRISIGEEERAKLKNLKLIPGMPVEIFVSTGDRTALSYLTKPFVDQMTRAFRE